MCQLFYLIDKMTHIEAIQKLIERNKSLVRKSGVSAYTRESDDIVNALLRYVKASEKESSALKEANKRMNVLLTLLGVPEAAKEIDSEFLERYLKFDIVPEMWIQSGGDADTYEFHIDDFIRAYEHARGRIELEYENYLLLKELFSNEKLTSLLEQTNPREVKWFRKQYTESEIKEEIKRSIYYNL